MRPVLSVITSPAGRAEIMVENRASEDLRAETSFTNATARSAVPSSHDPSPTSSGISRPSWCRPVRLAPCRAPNCANTSAGGAGRPGNSREMGWPRKHASA